MGAGAGAPKLVGCSDIKAGLIGFWCLISILGRCFGVLRSPHNEAIITRGSHVEQEKKESVWNIR